MEGEEGNLFTVYRGIGLPEKAIEVYAQMLPTEDWFSFTGYTAASIDK